MKTGVALVVAMLLFPLHAMAAAPNLDEVVRASRRVRPDHGPQGGVQPERVQQEPEPDDSRPPGSVFLKKGGKLRWEYTQPTAAGDRVRRQDAVGLHADR